MCGCPPVPYDGRSITTDSADAACWRLFLQMTGLAARTSAAQAAQKYNDMTAQLAQYKATVLAEALAGHIDVFEKLMDEQTEACADAIRFRNPNDGPSERDAMSTVLIDYHALDIGGMPAYRQALRALEAGYLELSDRLAAHLQAHAGNYERITIDDAFARIARIPQTEEPTR